MLKLHNVHGNKMLASLWLWVRLVTCDEEESCVHDGRTRQHCRHECIVTWAIHERDVPCEDQWRVALSAVNHIRFFRAERFETLGWLTIHALVELGISVAKLDRDIS